jgi:hypothetical protein
LSPSCGAPNSSPCTAACCGPLSCLGSSPNGPGGSSACSPTSCREVRLTTTNDNVDALRFYQRRGFRLAELRPGAVDRSRQEKPQIPRTGDYGIPLHDEIDLTLRV